MNTSYLGIHITNGRQAFHFAALDEDLRILALGKGDLREMTAFAGGQANTLAAVGGPVHLLRPGEHPDPISAGEDPPGGSPSAGGRACRSVEKELSRLGFDLPHTPQKIKDCPEWMRSSFNLHTTLRWMGYLPLPSDAPRRCAETWADAIFWALLGKPALPSVTLEGRLQRQLILFDLKLPVSDPMNFFEEITRFKLRRGNLPLDAIYAAEELDALAVAYCAWQSVHQPEQMLHLGSAGDGSEPHFILPRPQEQLQEKTAAIFPNLRL
jgi:hypothetical protein